MQLNYASTNSMIKPSIISKNLGDSHLKFPQCGSNMQRETQNSLNLLIMSEHIVHRCANLNHHPRPSAQL